MAMNLPWLNPQSKKTTAVIFHDNYDVHLFVLDGDQRKYHAVTINGNDEKDVQLGVELQSLLIKQLHLSQGEDTILKFQNAIFTGAYVIICSGWNNPLEYSD